MSKLSQVPLGALIELQRGFDLPKKNFIIGNVPVIASNGILGFHNKHKVLGPGVTIGRSGTVGRPYYITNNFFPHNTTLFVSDFKSNVPQYIYYLLLTLNLHDKKTGSGVPTMNRNHLHPLVVSAYLDKNEQQKIAHVLSTLDNKIELNNRINSELEAMAKIIYDYWFVQFDFPTPEDIALAQNNPNLIGKPYKSSGGKMIWNEQLKRAIPLGWTVGSLLNIADFVNGIPCQKFRPTNQEFLPVIKIKEMTEGFSNKTELVTAHIPTKSIINNGDVLFSWSASLVVKIWTGGKGALNQHIFKVTSKQYPKTFYYAQLQKYLSHFKMLAENRKTTMGHITQEHLQQSKIILPPLELIKKLDTKIKSLIDQKIRCELENQELAQLRDWLLPMLMNGQVKVK